MKVILTSLLLFISINLFSQEDRISTYIYDNKKTQTKDTVRVDKRLVRSFFRFIGWADKFGYDYRNRIPDIEGVYYNELVDPKNVGITYLFNDRKDYSIINIQLKLGEVIEIVLFHELFHLFAATGTDDHCYGIDCSSIMYPFLDGHIGYTLSNWEKEVGKLFAKLKVIEYGKQKDYITKCEIFSRGKK